MELNEDSRKIIATLALIEDTQKEISRARDVLDDQVRQLRATAHDKIEALELNLLQQSDALSTLVGGAVEEERGLGFSRYNYGGKKSTNRLDLLKYAALLHIGKLIVYPKEKTEDGQALSSVD